MLKKLRKVINRTFMQATGNPAFCRVSPKHRPLVTPLFLRFRLQPGIHANGRKVLVSDVTSEKLRQELEEQIVALAPTLPWPERAVTIVTRPLALQIPNVFQKPAPVPWTAKAAASIQQIPLGLAYGWGGIRPLYWHRELDAHALIAGITGSGKSVLMQSMVSSLAWHVGPDDLEIAAIDMKGRSLKVFSRLPHVRHPVAVERSEALALLHAVVSELDRRIQVGDGPAILLAIDELTDLLEGDTTAQGWLYRLARMGRELNILLLCGTQKPLMSEVGQAKSLFGLRLVGRMRNGQDAQTAAGVAVDADTFVHPGTFYAVNGSDRKTLFRAMLINAASVADEIARRWPDGQESVLHTVETRVTAASKIETVIAEDRQAREDLEMLTQAFGDLRSSSPSMRKMIEALGLNPQGSMFYRGKERVQRALGLLTTYYAENELSATNAF